MRPSHIKVLNALRRKRKGITIEDFGKGFRLAARVHELRQAGYAILTMNGEVATYILTREPCQTSSS